MFLKEEAYDYLEQDTVKGLVVKYSQFINFNIYMWSSKTETVEEPLEEEETEKPAEEEEKKEVSLVALIYKGICLSGNYTTIYCWLFIQSL